MSKWYVVLTKPKQEERAEEHLRVQSGGGFLPVLHWKKCARVKEFMSLNHYFQAIFLSMFKIVSGLVAGFYRRVGDRCFYVLKFSH